MFITLNATAMSFCPPIGCECSLLTLECRAVITNTGTVSTSLGVTPTTNVLIFYIRY